MTDPTSAAGADTLLGVLDEAASLGYDTQQIAHQNGAIECTACTKRTPAGGFDVEHVRRLEGASDAADLLLVAWAPCPNCGERGALVLGYGPNASSDDVAVLEQLDLTGADPAPTSSDRRSDTPSDTDHQR